VVDIESLATKEGLEEAVAEVQGSCLAGMLRVSMDRVDYSPVGEELAPGEEEALDEIRLLEEKPQVNTLSLHLLPPFLYIIDMLLSAMAGGMT
jgi:hypothetical protein